MDRRAAEQLFRAYRYGLLRNDSDSARERRPNFQILFLQLLWTQLPLAERLVFRKIWKLGLRGLHAAREGRLGESAQCFDEARELMDQGTLRAEGRLLSVSFLESAHAYLEHRHGRFDRAAERTLLAMDADVQLEERDAYSLLQLHRIQGANNLMRIDVRTGSYVEALDLAGRILAFLEDRMEDLPVHHGWDPASLRRAPRAIRSAMAAQVANEAVLALATAPGDRASKTFLDLVGPRDDGARGLIIHRRLRFWVDLKRRFEDRDWPAYLERLEGFLAEGRGDIGPLWYGSLIDFLEFCRIEGSPVAAFVRRGILRDSPKWPLVPGVFREWLSHELPEDPEADPSSVDPAPPIRATDRSVPSSQSGAAVVGGIGY